MGERNPIISLDWTNAGTPNVSQCLTHHPLTNSSLLGPLPLASNSSDPVLLSVNDPACSHQLGALYILILAAQGLASCLRSMYRDSSWQDMCLRG